eukprot:3153881-Rhodomonas_salina.1
MAHDTQERQMGSIRPSASSIHDATLFDADADAARLRRWPRKMSSSSSSSRFSAPFCALWATFIEMFGLTSMMAHAVEASERENPKPLQQPAGFEFRIIDWIY